MAAPASVPPRRGPGRPRKVQPPTLDETPISGVGDRGNTGNQDSAGLVGHSASTPTSSVHDPPPASGSMAAPASVPPRRGPGRPRKVQPPTPTDGPPTKFTTTKVSKVLDRGNTGNTDSPGLSASTPASARSAGPMTRARRGSPMPDPPDGTDLYAPLRRKYRKRSSLANEVTPASANAGAGKSAAPDKATPDAGSDEGVKLAQKLNQLADKILSAHSSVFASAASDRASQPSPSLGETSSDGPARMSPYDALVELRRTPLDVFLADERNPRPSILDLPLSAGTDSALDMALDSEPRPSLFDAALKVVADAALDLGVDPQRRPSSSVAPLPPAPPTVADPLDPTAPAHAVAADPVTRERPPPTRSQKPKPPAAANTAADPTDRAYLDAKLMARRVADGEVSDIASDVDAPDSPPAERDVRRSRRSRRHRRSRSLSLSIPVLKPRPRTDVQPYRGGPLLAADRGTAVTDQGSPARTLRTRWTFGDDDDAPVRARVWAQHDRESATIDRGRTSKRRHHLLSDEDDHVDVDVNDDEEEEDLPPPLPPRANGALAGSIFGRPGVAGRMIRIVGAPSRRGRYAQEEEEDEDEDVEMEME
ncbi:MAG: hypothetical protein M1826_005199 [Phylliscum demangeonii]|nr:MAG: hypothetical protein M1826_005199 [Phylliscum demangeonii]